MAKPLRVIVEASLGDVTLRPGEYVQIHAGEYCVEITCKPDSLQVCVDDQTFESGVHRFEEIYGP